MVATTGDVTVMCVMKVSLFMYRVVHAGECCPPFYSQYFPTVDCLIVVMCDSGVSYIAGTLGTVFVTADFCVM